MKTRWILFAIALCISAPAFSIQDPTLEAKKEDPAEKVKEEKRKRLAEINKVQDEKKKRELLEAFVNENTDPVEVDGYSPLMILLARLEPQKAVELADQILSKPVDPKTTGLRRTAHLFKFIALQNMIRNFGKKILETETDPRILQTAADFDRDNRLKLYEKAIAERAKDPQDDFPTLADLYQGYARQLSDKGQKEEAIQNMFKSLEASNARIAQLEALPEKDPKRRSLKSLRGSFTYQYRDIARLMGEAGQAVEGLEYLKKAEAAADTASLDQMFAIEDIRAKLYATLDRKADALESYTKLFSFQMSMKNRDKLRDSAKKLGKPPEDYFAQAREMRLARAKPFAGFNLKSIEGEARSMADFKGKVTLVNFFFPT